MLVCLAFETFFKVLRMSPGKRTEICSWEGFTTTTFEKSYCSSASRMIALTDLTRPSRTGSLKRSRNSTSMVTGKGRDSLSAIFSEVLNFFRWNLRRRRPQFCGIENLVGQCQFQCGSIYIKAGFPASEIVTEINGLRNPAFANFFQINNGNDFFHHAFRTQQFSLDQHLKLGVEVN